MSRLRCRCTLSFSLPLHLTNLSIPLRSSTRLTFLTTPANFSLIPHTTYLIYFGRVRSFRWHKNDSSRAKQHIRRNGNKRAPHAHQALDGLHTRSRGPHGRRPARAKVEGNEGGIDISFGSCHGRRRPTVRRCGRYTSIQGPITTGYGHNTQLVRSRSFNGHTTKRPPIATHCPPHPTRTIPRPTRRHLLHSSQTMATRCPSRTYKTGREFFGFKRIPPLHLLFLASLFERSATPIHRTRPMRPPDPRILLRRRRPVLRSPLGALPSKA
jgi:hypothetical protein